MKQKPEDKDDFTLKAYQVWLLKMDADFTESFFAKYSGNKAIECRFIDMLEENRKLQLAMLSSMTNEEKEYPATLSESRLHRIANGSGASVKDIDRMIKQYEKMCESMLKIKSLPPDNDLPPAVAARMPIPKSPVITNAVGRKYR